MNRYHVVNAYVAYVTLHGDKKLAERLRKPAIHDLADHCFSLRCDYNESDVLDRLESEELAIYFGLVHKLNGEAAFAEEVDTWRRINSIDGVEIIVENSDDDPTRVDFHINDPIAGQWADKHGSLDGGTWESDGAGFCYDSTYWHPKLFEELQKEGFSFDFSQYGEPDEHDLEVSRHACDCDECQGDWRQGEKHLAEGIEEVAQRKLSKKG